MTLHELREARTAKVAECRRIIAAAESAKRDLTDTERQQFDSLKTEISKLEEREARQQFLDDAERRAAGTPISDSGTRDFDRMASQVSVLRVLRAQMEGRSLDGAEREYAQEAERRTGRRAQGVFVPMQALERRAVDTTAAGDLVGTDHRADLYISPLRNSLLARRLGVRVLSGLTGNVSIPKAGTATSVGWVAEGGTLSTTSMTFDSVTLAPKHAGGLLEMSRQLIQQSSPDIEQLVRDDLAFALAAAIDSALINGGGNNEPTGILSASDTQSHNLATLDWPELMAMVKKAELVNATPNAFLTSPHVVAALRSTPKDTSSTASFPSYILEVPAGGIAGIPVYSTNQVPLAGVSPSQTGQLILGDFTQALLGLWSEVDLLVNPYESTAYARGGVMVRAMSTCDVAIRHPGAFVIADDLVV